MSEDVTVVEGDDGVVSSEINPGGTPPAEKPWFEGVVSDVSLLSDKDKEYKSFDDYVKATHNARKMAAGKLAVPGENASDEERAAFKAEALKHLGDVPVAPESADGYELEMFKEDSPLPAERVSGIKAAFHEAGLSNAQANAALNIYGEQMALDVAEAQAQIEATRKENVEALKGEWGADAADRMKGMDRIAAKYPELMEAAKAVGLDGRKDFMLLLDDVARGTAEDDPGEMGEGGGGGADSIDEQIAAVKANPKYKKGSVFEREPLMKKLDELYSKKAALRRR